MPDSELLDLSDDELQQRLVQRNVDDDLAVLLVIACRAGDADSIDTLHGILT